jgi:hypothetical protein
VERPWNWEADWNGDQQKQRRGADSERDSHHEESYDDLQSGPRPQQYQGQHGHDHRTGAIEARGRARSGGLQESPSPIRGSSGGSRRKLTQAAKSPACVSGEHQAISTDVPAPDSASGVLEVAEESTPQRPEPAME